MHLCATVVTNGYFSSKNDGWCYPGVPSPRVLLRVFPRLNLDRLRAVLGAGVALCVPWTPGRQVKAWCDMISSHLRTRSHVEAAALPVSCPSISLPVARKSHLIAGLDLPKPSSWDVVPVLGGHRISLPCACGVQGAAQSWVLGFVLHPTAQNYFFWPRMIFVVTL